MNSRCELTALGGSYEVEDSYRLLCVHRDDLKELKAQTQCAHCWVNIDELHPSVFTQQVKDVVNQLAHLQLCSYIRVLVTFQLLMHEIVVDSDWQRQLMMCLAQRN